MEKSMLLNGSDLAEVFSKIHKELDGHEAKIKNFYSKLDLISTEDLMKKYESIGHLESNGHDHYDLIEEFADAFRSLNQWPRNIRKVEIKDYNATMQGGFHGDITTIASASSTQKTPISGDDGSKTDEALRNYKKFVSEMNSVKAELVKSNGDLKRYMEKLSQIRLSVKEIKKATSCTDETAPAFSAKEEETLRQLSENVEHLNFQYKDLLSILTRNPDAETTQGTTVLLDGLILVESSNEIL